MNKLLSFILTGLIIVGLAGCNNSDANRPYSLSQISNPTEADSLMYYLGQLRAVKFWKDAASDSILKTRKAREEYLEGLRDGIKAIDRSEAYMLGLDDGASLAQNITDYSVNYSRKFDISIMLKSMASALAADSVENLPEIRRHFYAIRNRMEQDRDEREETRATAALVVAARDLGMTRINNDLWSKVLVQGGGDQIERGDRIEVAMQLTTREGHKIPLHLPSQIVVGARLISTIFSDAFVSMRYGDRCEFATTALALFGSHTAQMDLHPETILLLTISVIGEIDGADSDVINDGANHILIQDRRDKDSESELSK